MDVRRHAPLGALALLALCLTPACRSGGGGGGGGGGGMAGCIDFEDQTLGTTFAFGTTFQASGVDLTLTPYLWPTGVTTTGGSAKIDAFGRAGGSGNELRPNNVNVSFDFGRIERLELKFGELGGNVNIRVNGDLRNTANFADLNGQTIGGVTMTVNDPTGANRGTIVLDGVIEEFEVGGQELWIDDLCPTPPL